MHGVRCSNVRKLTPDSAQTKKEEEIGSKASFQLPRLVAIICFVMIDTYVTLPTTGKWRLPVT